MSAYTREDYARAAARRGWPVFPLRPGSKQPAVRGWEKRATTDLDQIALWWRQWPQANPGIATGRAGLVVIDLDRPKPGEHPPPGWERTGITDGADVLAALAEQAGARLLLDTFTVATRRGGMHLYYTAPPGTVLGNTTESLGWKIDTRATGGYVVGPGSRATGDDGITGDYTFVTTTAPAPLPGWLAAKLAPPGVATTPEASHSGGDAVLDAIATSGSARRDAYATAALRGELDKVLAAPEGQRNQSLYIAAVSLGQLAAENLLSTGEVTDALQRAAEAANSRGAPNAPREIAATIRSGLQRGLTVPRRTRTHAPKEAATP